MGRVAGKVALITGAARGQGRSHAVRLAEEGATIVALDICAPIETMRYPLSTPEDLEQTAKEVAATGQAVVARQVDVRNRDEIRESIDEAIARFGRLDIVVANAGICAAVDTTLCQAFVDSTDVDLIGTMNTVAAALPHLQAGASIIITGSTAGMIPGATDVIGASGGVGYSWAKQVIVRYVEVLALQLAPSMVRLNAIHPTNCDTHLLHNEDVYRAFRPDLEHPTREDAVPAFPAMHGMPIPWVDPLDVSHLVTYLASDESRYMTGMNIRLDAGAMLKSSFGVMGK
jgi:SDR family mycofactocin-dependent oxidoreductase